MHIPWSFYTQTGKAFVCLDSVTHAGLTVVTSCHRAALALGFGLLYLALGASASAANLLESVTPHSSPHKTQVVIKVSAPVESHSARLWQPDRLYLDLQNTRLPKTWKTSKIRVRDGLLRAIRVAQNRPHAVRVVLDLQNLEDYRIWTQTDPYRIIIDLYGEAAHTVDLAPKPKSRPPTIVIDPGHGGKDPGASGPSGLAEKTVVLGVAKQLRDLIKQTLPKARVVLTRERDVFIPLEKRAQIANEEHAHLFLSLHVNASSNRQASGIEMWYLSFAANEHGKKMAARENMMSEAELSDLQVILRDLQETDRINQSAILAGVMQRALVAYVQQHYTEIHDRGVDGAPFVVLLHTTMPSVLAELSFVSNARDEKRLRSRSYQRVIAQGILQGIRHFLQTAVASTE